MTDLSETNSLETNSSDVDLETADSNQINLKALPQDSLFHSSLNQDALHRDALHQDSTSQDLPNASPPTATSQTAGPVNPEEFNSKKLFKAKLKIVAMVGLGCVVLVAAGFMWFGRSKSPLPEDDKQKIITMDSGSTALDIDKMWRHKVEENLQTQNNSLSSKIEGVKEEITSVTDAKINQKDLEIRTLKEKMKFLQAEINETKQSPGNIASNGKSALSINEHKAIPKISKYKLNLTNSKNSKDYQPIKTPENYIAAGSFAEGVLLSGLDVSTSIKTASDPEPVLLRLTNFGTLPRRFNSDLKDCHIVGSAYGDLSSERAKIRIEKLSCVEIKTGEVVETEVSGYVSGEDGRSGLRGEIVSVDQKYMVNAQIFGTLGGLANTATKSPTIYNPLAGGVGAVQPLSTKENISNGLISGASSSLDKISDYYIDRAESIQPVVQVAAGREVDVIFTEGVYFGTSNLKRALSQRRDEKIKNISDRSRADHSRMDYSGVERETENNKINLMRDE